MAEKIAICHEVAQPVGASLLAKAVCQATSILADMASSPAGWLPQEKHKKPAAPVTQKPPAR
jgi:hypothetical protein